MTELHRVNVRVLRGNICAFPPAAQLLQRKGLKHSRRGRQVLLSHLLGSAGATPFLQIKPQLHLLIPLLSVGERPQNTTIPWDTLPGTSPAPVSPALPQPTTAPASNSRAPASGSVLLPGTNSLPGVF